MGEHSGEQNAIGEALLRRQRDGQPGSPGFMDRQRDALQEQVSAAMKQIEQLRLRQDQLSHEKTEIESLLRRQSEYLAAKNTLVSQLRNGVAVMERRESQTTRLLELVREARASFAQTLERLERIDEETWADRSFDTELASAAALVAEAKAMRERLLAQIEAASWRGAEPGETAGGWAIDASALRVWFMRGLAFGAPAAGLALLVYLLIRLMS